MVLARNMCGALGVFCTVLWSVNTETCDECIADNWASCNGTETVCLPEEKCVSVASRIIEVVPLGRQGTRRKITPEVRRACSEPHFTSCDTLISFNFKFASQMIQRSCNGKTIGVALEERPNGRLCWGCIAVESECTRKVECRGGEDYCIKVVDDNYAVTKMVSKGCATESLCKLPLNGTKALGTVIFGKRYCCTGNLCNGAWTGACHSAVLFLFLLPLWIFL
ncbi:phospholipase A2 inhibitor gamma subunit B-like [Amia ocellicauda]|uniref:phospholipase A2 inhibitor gamma subunit B-like n=1 Tax=Amia ocellicauda TaxID=2972642 RepID=UPI0034642F76